MEKIPYLGHTLQRWQVGNATFLALPEKGARLMNWHLTLADGSVRDVLYWPELTQLDGFAQIRGGNPILFPFNARTFDRGLIHHWRAPDGVRRPMPMHGLARQGEFEVIWLDARGFAVEFKPDEEARHCYPYRYSFTVTYRFEPLGLACEFALNNLDTQPIPWSAGHHFYFSVPWREGLTRGDYGLHVPAARTYRQDTAGQLVPGPTFKSRERMDNPELVDAIHSALKSAEVSFGPLNGNEEVRVRLGTSRVPPPESAVVTWSASAEAPYFCVEPWMGPPNAAEHGVGLHWVQPGQQEKFVVEIGLT